jgi:hypothetical protein
MFEVHDCRFGLCCGLQWLPAFQPYAVPAARLAPQKKTKPKIKYYRINTNQTIHVRLDQTISSETARVGDTFTTTVVHPVYS